jgi:UDP-N-acetylmuramate dehydrogenase
MSADTHSPRLADIVVTDGAVRLSIQQDARTDLYSTFRVGGPADYLVRAGTIEELQLAMAWARDQGLLVTIFGGGSNLLVSDQGVRGLVLVVRRPGQESGIEVLEDSGHEVLVRVPATAPLSRVAKEAAERGWAGLSWAVGLPGNVGGATVNNAGAHGTELKDNLRSLRVLEGGEVGEHDRAWLDPSYRRTRLKASGNPRESVVVDVDLLLPLGDAEELRAEGTRLADYRRRTQPTGACAGSIFKNPEGTYAGLVVEQAGLKGTAVGGALVSLKHANFIVNQGGATAGQIIELMALVQERVRDELGIDLHPEIERVGEW